MKTLEQLAAETFPLGNETCPSKVLAIKYNQAKMVKAVRGWLEGQQKPSGIMTIRRVDPPPPPPRERPTPPADRHLREGEIPRRK